MTPLFPDELSASFIDRSPFVVLGGTVPPRDPDGDGDDEDEDEEEGDEDEGAEEPPVVREPDEG